MKFFVGETLLHHKSLDVDDNHTDQYHSEERKRLGDLGLNQHILASNISLLRASEVEDIIEGREEKYRAVSVQTIEPLFPK